MRGFIAIFLLKWPGVLAFSAYVTLTLPLVVAGAARGTAGPQPSSSFDPGSIPIYIGELELHAVLKPADRLPDAKPKVDPAGSAPAKPLYTEDETPTKLSRSVVRTLQSSLLQSFAKIGYKAQATPGGARPARGVEVRGVFAETDEMNRIRRTILGAGSQNPKLLLYIGVANLAKPEQPLYQQVIPNATVPNTIDNRYGPVISISAYVPVAKFQLDRSPSNEDLDKTAQAIAAQVDAVIRNNASAVAGQ